MVLSAGGVCGQAASTGSGQDFPSKPIRILTGSPGGSSDFTSRQIAQGLTERLGQQVIVENRAILASDIVAKAQPDAYTLLLDGGSFWVAPLLQATPYDVVRDFLPISTAISSIYILVVHTSLPAKSVKELIALAKAKPGTINFASSGIGGAAHLAAELFKVMAGVNLVHVPYKGSGLSLTAMIGGQEVQMLFAPGLTSMPHVKAGRLNALAVASSQPSALVPGLPTVAASVPGYEATQLLGVFAPAKTSAARVNQLSQEIVQVLNQPEVKARLLGFGLEATGSTPQEFAALLKSEITKWGKLIKEAGIKGD